MAAYHNSITNNNGTFHYNEEQRGQNRDISITTPNGTRYTFSAINDDGPIQLDQNWYHNNIITFYDALANTIIQQYNAATDNFNTPVNVVIHRTTYNYK